MASTATASTTTTKKPKETKNEKKPGTTKKTTIREKTTRKSITFESEDESESRDNLKCIKKDLRSEECESESKEWCRDQELCPDGSPGQCHMTKQDKENPCCFRYVCDQKHQLEETKKNEEEEEEEESYETEQLLGSSEIEELLKPSEELFGSYEYGGPEGDPEHFPFSGSGDDVSYIFESDEEFNFENELPKGSSEKHPHVMDLEDMLRRNKDKNSKVRNIHEEEGSGGNVDVQVDIKVGDWVGKR